MPNPGVQRIVTTAVLLIAAAGAASPSRAQTSAAQPAFDVASVKPNASGDWRKSLGPAPGGRFLATNQTLRDLLPFAYGLPQMAAGIRIVGGPSWIDADRFVIVARAEGTPSPEQLGGTLVMSRAGGALGTRLRRSEVSEERPHRSGTDHGRRLVDGAAGERADAVRGPSRPGQDRAGGAVRRRLRVDTRSDTEAAAGRPRPPADRPERAVLVHSLAVTARVEAGFGEGAGRCPGGR